MFGKKPAEKKIKKEVKEEEALVLYEDKTYENEVTNQEGTKETVQETKSSTTFGV
jgi:spore coat protein CotF